MLIHHFSARQLLDFAAGGGAVQDSVAYSAKCYQVGLGVVAKGAASCDVVNVEIPRASALLTMPTVPAQDFAP